MEIDEEIKNKIDHLSTIIVEELKKKNCVFMNFQIEEEISTKASSERTENNQDYYLFRNKSEEVNENQSNKVLTPHSF